MSRIATATISRLMRLAQHAPYQPPLAHRVRIPAPYLPACATNVGATIERVSRQLQARVKTSRRAAIKVAQPDLFTGAAPHDDAVVVCIAAVQKQRRKAA